MSELPVDKSDVRKLAHAYIALAFAQYEAKRYVRKHGAHALMLPLLTSLEMTAELLEEVLQQVQGLRSSGLLREVRRVRARLQGAGRAGSEGGEGHRARQGEAEIPQRVVIR